jgi:phospholipid/cholesterol/gamma-HCH transport system substrate-binding protein
VSPEARVGLVSLAAFALIVVTVVFLRGGALGQEGYDLTIVLRNAGGIEKGAPVRMSGVPIGRVKNVVLGPFNQPQVVITVRRGVDIPVGSRFKIATSGLLGDRYISIDPGPPANPAILPNSQIVGEDPFTFESLTDRLAQIADRVEVLVNNLNETIADPETRENLRVATRNVRQTTEIAKQAATNVEQTSREFHRMVTRDGAVIVQNLRRMSTTLMETAGQLQGFIDETTGNGALARDIRETATHARDLSRRLDRMAADLQQGLLNPDTIASARDTVQSVRETAAEARDVVRRAGDLVNRAGGVINGGGLPGMGTLVRLDYEVWHANQRSGHSLNLFLFPERPRFFTLGVHDIGMANTLVLQVGQRLNPSLALRAGVFESQVGIGLDYQVFEPLLLSVDLYDVNRPTFDAIARYRLGRDWKIMLGGKSLPRQPSFYMGIGRGF